MPLAHLLRIETANLLAIVFFLTMSIVLGTGYAMEEEDRRASWRFVDATNETHLNWQHGFVDTANGFSESRGIAQGLAVTDYDRDGWYDVFAVTGDRGPNLLFRNLGNGSFEEVAAAAGVSEAPLKSSGAVFADIDGDGWDDLIVGAIDGETPRVFRNLGDGSFEDITALSAFNLETDTYSFTLGDIDRDGDLALASAHWLFGALQLWRNDGSGAFSNITKIAGIDREADAFTSHLLDITGDGWLDILVATDFGTSRVFINDGNGSYVRVVDHVISDENGMGSAVADYDNDGAIDWFVTSIWDPNRAAEGNWGTSGNRLYRYLGPGEGFVDITDASGVRAGYWGWGACAEDFNNDGYVDLFHVNGFDYDGSDERVAEYRNDPARLFVNDGTGAFTEVSAERGIADTGQGRAAVCFDYDRDGDVDVLIGNNHQRSKLYRNEGGHHLGNFLSVELHASGPNRRGIGSRILLTAAGATQTRFIEAGGTFAGSKAPLAHFGLGTAQQVETLRVMWPDGTATVLERLNVNQHLSVVKGGGPALSVGLTPISKGNAP